MPRELEAEGLVLNRKLAGERHLRLSMLTPTLGLIAVLARESRPAGKSAAASRLRSQASPAQRPDIFDLAAVRLDPPEPGAAHGHVYFLCEYKVLRRHGGLGRNYAALEAAAGLAGLVSHNARHFENCAQVFELCGKAFAALDEGAPPEAVRLKAIFLLASSEGYAAKEHWLPTLPAAEQALALTVLNRPAAGAAVLSAADASRLPKLRRAFERWLAEHTDLECP